ncbi:hypothetical protein OEA41_008300 [Lepraria neglecta]|uniref:Uncharacterized protein n=1 Tax=Lepraria neglecta TaxID=209136 RepID=A0AAD9ZH67_9LECA|nr:hypothetical protein OEA41_008300 [Lepraria neglecta]
MKALNDIETAFFKSRLRGKVIVKWTESSELFERGHNRIPRGTHSGHEDGASTISLNADKIFQSRTPFLQMWRTKVHELVVISKGEKHYKDDHMMSERWAEKQDIRNNNLVSRDHDADDYPMTSAPTPNYRVANGYSKSPYRSSARSPPVTDFDHAGLNSNNTY